MAEQERITDEERNTRALQAGLKIMVGLDKLTARVETPMFALAASGVLGSLSDEELAKEFQALMLTVALAKSMSMWVTTHFLDAQGRLEDADEDLTHNMVELKQVMKDCLEKIVEVIGNDA